MDMGKILEDIFAISSKPLKNWLRLLPLDFGGVKIVKGVKITPYQHFPRKHLFHFYKVVKISFRKIPK